MYTNSSHFCLNIHVSNPGNQWYRLVLNSSQLQPFLYPHTRDEARNLNLPIWALGFLEISLTAAAQILFSVSSSASSHIWDTSSQDASTFPQGPFAVDPEARKSLHHAVDSTWISYTFAIIFLVLCYVRKAIDGMHHSIRDTDPTTQLC